MVTKKITLSLIVGALFSTLAPASADFLLARRLPTGKQILNISRFDLDREKDATTFSNTLVLKGFSPSGAGAILSLPYVSRETPAGHAEGLGDVSITTTQIFDPLKGLGIAPYLSVKFPTGEYDSKRKVNPGSGRFDTSLGTTATYNGKYVELDARVERTFQTTNSKTGVDLGDVTRASFSLAYTHPGLWVGVEALEQRFGADERFGRRTSRSRNILSIGPETRFKVGEGKLIHIGGKVDDEKSYAIEARFFWNF